jgi:hypothetical protein
MWTGFSAPTALQEHHQRLRDLPRQLLAVVVLQQGECEIDPRRHTR